VLGFRAVLQMPKSTYQLERNSSKLTTAGFKELPL
jgi:hypothetical protein